MGRYVFNPWTAELDRVGGGASEQADQVLATGSATAVGASTLTTVASYTATDKTRIARVLISGEVYGCWTITLDTGGGDTMIVTKYLSPDRDRDIELNIELAATDVIKAKIEHARPGTHDFAATILGR